MGKRIAAALLLGAACVTPPTVFEATYLRPEFRTAHYTTVVVAPLSGDDALRKVFADNVLQYLRTWTARAERGADVLPQSLYDPRHTGHIDPNVDRNIVRKHLYDAGFQAVLTVAYHPKENETPGVPHAWSEDPLREYFKRLYEQAGAEAANPEGEVLIETNLYDTATGRVVWSGHSRTVKSSDTTLLAQSYAAAVVDELVKLGLIGKQ